MRQKQLLGIIKQKFQFLKISILKKTLIETGFRFHSQILFTIYLGLHIELI